MSAIFGILDARGSAVIGRELAQMDHALAPFGTRTAAFLLTDVIGMGHRSRPFTPEDASECQPLVERDLTIVFDGRIDDRGVLVRRLGMTADMASAVPDCILALNAFRRWGSACAGHIVGPFAFAIWDARRRELFVVRSPLGGRLIFYHRVGARLVFATSVTAVAAVVPRALNEEKLARSLMHGGGKPEHTFFSGISRLLPGHYLVANATGSRTERFWTPDDAHRIRFARDEDYVEAFRALYDGVVADHLRGASPAGLMLSGGLDSASIAATVQRRGDRLLTYTQVPAAGEIWDSPPGYYADETAPVHAIASMYPGLEPHFIDASAANPFAACDRVFDLTGAPFRSVTNRTWYEQAIIRARSAGARIMLTGEQGNLTISWAGHGLIAELLRERNYRRFVGEMRSAVGQGTGAALVREMLGRMMPERASRAAAFQAEYSAAHPEMLHRYPPVRQPVGSGGTDARYATLTAPDASQNLIAAYRAMYDVDVRVPLMDPRLVRFCLALPEAQQRRAGVSRWLIRRAMAGRLPPAVLHNRQRGLQAADWMKTLRANRACMIDELRHAQGDPLARHLLDLTKLNQLVVEMPTNDAMTTRTAWLYRDTLPRGVIAARYLRWFSSRRR